jgi:hypothetical protein
MALEDKEVPNPSAQQDPKGAYPFDELAKGLSSGTMTRWQPCACWQVRF